LVFPSFDFKGRLQDNFICYVKQFKSQHEFKGIESLFIIWDFLYRKVLGHFPKGKNTRKYVIAGKPSKLVLLAAQTK
jgi:hypothetical protein